MPCTCRAHAAPRRAPRAVCRARAPPRAPRAPLRTARPPQARPPPAPPPPPPPPDPVPPRPPPPPALPPAPLPKPRRRPPRRRGAARLPPRLPRRQPAAPATSQQAVRPRPPHSVASLRRLEAALPGGSPVRWALRWALRWAAPPPPHPGSPSSPPRRREAAAEPSCSPQPPSPPRRRRRQRRGTVTGAAVRQGKRAAARAGWSLPEGGAGRRWRRCTPEEADLARGPRWQAGWRGTAAADALAASPQTGRPQTYSHLECPSMTM